MYSEALLTGQNLPLSEALAMGGQTTVIGLAIVFAVLIILMIVLSLFKVIFYKKPKTQAAPAAAPAQAAPVEEEKADDTDEEELIAVLTAAVAASLNTSTYNLRIKSYRRTDNKMPAWNKAGFVSQLAYCDCLCLVGSYHGNGCFTHVPFFTFVYRYYQCLPVC